MECVLVVGAGFMGSGIAQVCAQAGYRVHLMDVKREALNKAINEIHWSVEKLSTKGVIKGFPQTVLERITAVEDLKSAKDVSWVIEAALEVENLKHEIFQELDRLVPVETPLATTTSSIPITRSFLTLISKVNQEEETTRMY